ncbi:MAG TPA: hypothetical protein VGT41_06705 [Candidatus Babeliales bacterium]|nr:hypothetical protein [Candidatus Babeliales bacterium]
MKLLVTTALAIILLGTGNTNIYGAAETEKSAVSDEEQNALNYICHTAQQQGNFNILQKLLTNCKKLMQSMKVSPSTYTKENIQQANAQLHVLLEASTPQAQTATEIQRAIHHNTAPALILSVLLAKDESLADLLARTVTVAQTQLPKVKNSGQSNSLSAIDLNTPAAQALSPIIASLESAQIQLRSEQNASPNFPDHTIESIMYHNHIAPTQSELLRLAQRMQSDEWKLLDQEVKTTELLKVFQKHANMTGSMQNFVQNLLPETPLPTPPSFIGTIVPSRKDCLDLAQNIVSSPLTGLAGFAATQVYKKQKGPTQIGNWLAIASAAHVAGTTIQKFRNHRKQLQQYEGQKNKILQARTQHNGTNPE